MIESFDGRIGPVIGIRRKFTKDAAVLVAGSASQHAFLLLLQVLLARKLAVDEFGRLYFFNGLLSLFVILGTAGISAWLPALARRRLQAGQAPPQGMLAWAALISLLFALGNASAYVLGAYERFQVGLGPLYFWMSAQFLAICITQSIQGIFIGVGRTREVFILNFCMDAAKLLFPVLLVANHRLGLTPLIVGWSVIHWLGVGANAMIYLRWLARTPIPERIDWRWTRDHADALAFLLPSGATLLLPRLLIFLTGMIHSAERTAEVGVAMIFMAAFGLMLIPYQTALLSHFQDYRGGALLAPFLRRTSLELAGIILSMGVVAWLAGHFLIVPMFGPAFMGTRDFLGLLVLVFAMDAPRALLDVFFVTLLPKRNLVLIDLLRFLGIVAVFLAPGTSLPLSLAGVALLSLAANAFKAVKVATYLRNRSWEAR